MIDFKRLELSQKARYDNILMNCEDRGCEYSFVNLFLWGRQKAAFLDGFLVLQSQFDRRSVYPFPVGQGDVGPILDAVIADARARGIPCCLTSLSAQECELLEARYPGRFRFHTNRDNFDYVYDINRLADLKGRKYQKKRNHLHRFQDAHPDCRFVPIEEIDSEALTRMLRTWYENKKAADPSNDFHLEELAIQRALKFRECLAMEGLALMEGDELLAFTLGSRLNATTFDIHFEKAVEETAYAAINQAFARHLREKYPEVRFLNREDDMGLEGLRKAKLSYSPDKMVEKYWARLWEDEDEHHHPA